MKDTFNLSEKIRTDGSYQEVHVKTFIMKLKGKLCDHDGGKATRCWICYWIDNLAGKELCK